MMLILYKVNFQLFVKIYRNIFSEQGLKTLKNLSNNNIRHITMRLQIQ